MNQRTAVRGGGANGAEIGYGDREGAAVEAEDDAANGLGIGAEGEIGGDAEGAVGAEVGGAEGELHEDSVGDGRGGERGGGRGEGVEEGGGEGEEKERAAAEVVARKRGWRWNGGHERLRR